MFLQFMFLCFIFSRSAGLTVKQLHGKYWAIFSRSGNRNAASHLWATYIFKQVQGNATAEEIYTLFGGFCPVSGSPVTPSEWNSWKNLKLRKATNTSVVEVGTVHVCCWPCICDIQELVKVDTIKISTKNGVKEFRVLVIGDPCVNSSKIPSSAPEIYCKNNVLQDATPSANGHVVIGMLQPSNAPAKMKAEKYEQKCDNRRKNNYKWGMGKIFVRVASINPINS